MKYGPGYFVLVSRNNKIAKQNKTKKQKSVFNQAHSKIDGDHIFFFANFIKNEAKYNR